MARKVKISSLGIQPPFLQDEAKNSPEKLKGDIIGFWKNQIEIVLPDRPDLIVLPELCDYYTGIPHEMFAWYRDMLSDEFLNALQQIAKANSCYIAFGTTRKADDGTWRNAALMLDRNGELIGQYNKNHTVVTEIDCGIVCGTQAPVVQCDFGSVGFAICFDLNFDELRLKYKALGPDLLLFPSQYHGGLMQSYWAYSCRTHFVGCVGTDTLPSEFYSPVGTRLATSTNYCQTVTHTVNLDCVVVHLDFNVEKLTALKEKYGPDVAIFDPGQLACVLVTSESETVSIQEMVAEFEIELLDDYLARSLEQHHNLRSRHTPN